MPVYSEENYEYIGNIAGGLGGNTTSNNLFTNDCYYLDSSFNKALNNSTYTGCIAVSEIELIKIADKLGLPFVNNINENLNNGYPVFEWQINNVSIKPNVNSGFKGKGTFENPYQISSAKDLNRLSELINDEATNPLFRYAYYVQMNDIDLRDVDFT